MKKSDKMTERKLKKRNERIRGPNLAVLISFSKGVPFEEGLRRADAENLVVASSKRLIKALVKTQEWRKKREKNE